MKKQYLFSGRQQAVIFFLGISLIVSLSGYLYFLSEKKNVKNEVYRSLRAISSMKVAELEQWQRERLSEARFFSAVNPYASIVSRILKGDKIAEESMRKHLQRIMSDKRYRNIYLLDSTGKKLFAVNGSLEPSNDKEIINYIKVSYKTKKIAVRDFFLNRTDNTVHLDIISPVLDENGKVLAALVLCIEPNDYLHPLIQNWPLPSRSAEAYIVRKDGDSIVYLSDLKFVKNRDMSLKHTINDTIINAVRGINGSMGIMEGKDYRGERVLTCVCPVPGTSWMLVSEIDTSEVYDDLTKKAILIIIIIIVTVMFLGSVIAWTYNYRQRFISRELVDRDRELSVSRGEMGATLFNIEDGIIILDNLNKIRQINPVTERLTGWSEREAIGRQINEVCVFEIEQLEENGISEDYPGFVAPGQENYYNIVSRNGNRIAVSFRYIPIKDKDGTETGSLVVIRDETTERTRRKILESRLSLFRFSTNHTLSESLCEILNTIDKFISFPAGFITLLDEDEINIRLTVYSSKADEFFNNAGCDDFKKFPAERSMWRECIASRDSVIFFHKLSNNEKITFIYELVVPVIRSDKVVSVVSLMNYEPGFTVQQKETLNYLFDVDWEVAESKIMAENLLESEEKYRLLLNNSLDAIMMADNKGNILGANTAACEMFNMTQDEIIERGRERLFNIADPRFYEHLSELERLGQSKCELTMLNKFGTIIPVELSSALFNSSKGEVLESLVIRNITERVKMEQSIKKTEETRQILYNIARSAISTDTPYELFKIVKNELSRVIDTSKMYISLYNVEKNHFRTINPATSAWTIDKSEYYLEDMLSSYIIRGKDTLLLSGNVYSEFVKSLGIKLKGNHVRCWLGVPLTEKFEVVGVVVVRSFNNETAFDKETARLLEMVAQEISGSMMRYKMISDLIIEKNRAEESDRLKSSFLANISHEIRTPMNGILGFVELLAAKDISEEERLKYIDIVRQSGLRLLGTINDIVEISKIESQQTVVSLEKVDTEELLLHFMDVFEKKMSEKGIKFTIEEYIKGKEAIVQSDKHKLYGILSNLINNAYKFTDSGVVSVGDYIDGKYLVFFVRDSGKGIPSDKLDAIFERFVQVDSDIASPYEGSGLGLSIVKAYVEALEGKVWVTSEIGKGSTFYFTIPK